MVEPVLEVEDRWLGILFGVFGAGIIVSSALMTLRPLPRRGLLLALSPVAGGPLLAIGPPAAIFHEPEPRPAPGANGPGRHGARDERLRTVLVLSAPRGFAQTGLVTSFVGPQVSIVASAIAGSVAGVALLVWLPVRKLR